MLELGWGLTKILVPVLYACSIIVIFLTIFYKIEIGLYFLVFFLPLQNILDYVNIYPLGKDINDILLVSLLIKWIINKKKDGEKILKKTPLNIPILLFLIWTYLGVWRGSEFLGLSSPLSLNNPLFASWKNFIIPFILFFVIVNNIKNMRNIKLLLIIMVFTIIVLDRNFYNILSLQDISHYSDALKNEHNSASVALSGNALAVFFAQYSIILVALFLFDSNKLRKALYGTVSALSYYCVMFLFSRSGYLAAGASWIFLGIVKEKRILAFLILIFLTWNTVLPTAVVERIEMTRSEEGFDGSAVQRLGMWKQAELMIADNPVLGVGYGITPFIEVTAGESYLYNYTWTSFHNNFLQTTVEIGLIGLALNLYLFFLGMYLGWRLFKIADNGFSKGLGLGFMCCVLATLAGNIAGSYWHYFTINSFFWAFYALVVKNIMIIEEQREKATEHISRETTVIESHLQTVEA